MVELFIEEAFGEGPPNRGEYPPRSLVGRSRYFTEARELQMTRFDAIISGGTVVDGLRNPRYKADVAIKDGRIAAIGSLNGAQADQRLDATGHIVAPGF